MSLDSERAEQQARHPRRISLLHVPGGHRHRRATPPQPPILRRVRCRLRSHAGGYPHRFRGRHRARRPHHPRAGANPIYTAYAWELNLRPQFTNQWNFALESQLSPAASISAAQVTADAVNQLDAHRERRSLRQPRALVYQRDDFPDGCRRGFAVGDPIYPKRVTASAPTKFSAHPDAPVSMERQFSLRGSVRRYTTRRFPSYGAGKLTRIAMVLLPRAEFTREVRQAVRAESARVEQEPRSE